MVVVVGSAGTLKTLNLSGVTQPPIIANNDAEGAACAEAKLPDPAVLAAIAKYMKTMGGQESSIKAMLRRNTTLRRRSIERRLKFKKRAEQK